MIPGPEIIAKFHFLRDAYVWAYGSATMPMRHKLWTLIVKFIKHVHQEYQGTHLDNFGHSGWNIYKMTVIRPQIYGKNGQILGIFPNFEDEKCIKCKIFCL